MKRLIPLLLCLTISSSSFGWGQTGHRVTGRIACNHLSKKAIKRIDRILNGHSIAMVSNFMDEIKSEPKYDSLGPWHYCTIPDGQKYSGVPEEGDVIQAIKKYIRILKSKELSKEEEAFSLKCLIHLVGDIHQPLHVGNGTDRGGNDVEVIYFWEPSNLHRVWDSGIIDRQNLSYREYTEWIDRPTKEQVDQWKNDDIMTWVKESISYRSRIYNLTDNGNINYRYNYENIAIVNLRLLQAGIRLAGILEDIYG
ncbi:MAG: S1/P1 nuclease [Cytophagales bacterium]|nr:S1/P1 nuclease [Cytophagales bacterium]